VRKSLILSVLVVALSAAAGAQPTTPMDVMQYYVGTWSCVGGPVGVPPAKATFTAVVELGVLREWIVVHEQDKQKSTFSIAATISYDAKKHRYVQTSLDSFGGWDVSVAKAWSGNTEHWADIANSDGKLGLAQIVRSDKDTYTLSTWETTTSRKPNFGVSCKRSS